jgi:hypothetical protein
MLILSSTCTEEGRPQWATNLDDWMKSLEAELAPLSSDMWATQKRLEEKGFRWIAAIECLAGGG